MLSNEKKPPKDAYFHLPPEDRMEFELEDREQQEKNDVAEKVIDELNKKK